MSQDRDPENGTFVPGNALSPGAGLRHAGMRRARRLSQLLDEEVTYKNVKMTAWEATLRTAIEDTLSLDPDVRRHARDWIGRYAMIPVEKMDDAGAPTDTAPRQFNLVVSDAMRVKIDAIKNAAMSAVVTTTTAGTGNAP